MIPGNRPEDQEIEVTLILSVGEIDDLKRFVCDKKYYKNDKNFCLTIEDIVEQIEDR